MPMTTAQVATIIGITQIVCAFLGALPLRFFGRKPILLFGIIGMGLCHLSAAVFLIMEEYTLMIIAVVIFRCLFPLVFGSCFFSYIAEVTVDSASGFTTSGYFLVSMGFQLSIEYMI